MSRIVIAEDDSMISEIYQKKFSDSGFEVLLATTGEQVVNLAKKEKLDVILLDLMIPKMNGFEVLKELRSGAYDAEIKIIICSNFSSREEQDKALELGANGFIVKSEYSPSDLVTEVQRRMGQYSEQKKNEDRLGKGAVAKGKAKGGKKILIMEDEEVFIDMFGERLKQDGFEVVFARNGAWGVKEALKENFDLFIVDMIMPAMTGDEIIAKLKMEEQTQNTPIIVLSASVDAAEGRRMTEIGAAAFFEKTRITPTQLAEKVAELLK